MNLLQAASSSGLRVSPQRSTIPSNVSRMEEDAMVGSSRKRTASSMETDDLDALPLDSGERMNREWSLLPISSLVNPAVVTSTNSTAEVIHQRQVLVPLRRIPEWWHCIVPACGRRLPHAPEECSVFHFMDVTSRWRLANTWHICPLCLSKGHIVDDCNSSTNCGFCNLRHHTLMH